MINHLKYVFLIALFGLLGCAGYQHANVQKQLNAFHGACNAQYGEPDQGYCVERTQCYSKKALPVIAEASPDTVDLYALQYAQQEDACAKLDKKQITLQEYRIRIAEHQVKLNSAIDARTSYNHPDPYMGQQIMNATNGLGQSKSQVIIPNRTQCRSMVTGGIVDTTCY